MIQVRHLWVAVTMATCLLLSSTTAARTTNNLRRHLQTGATAEEFINQCTAHLLSDDTVDDGLISQDEFTEFLSDYCVQTQVCPPGTSLEFQSLSVELQLAFVLFICNEPSESEREECLEGLNDMGTSFGYDVDIEEPEVLETEVQELCALAYAHSYRSGLLPPTNAPTQVPASTLPTENDDNGNGGNSDGSENEPNDGSSGTAGNDDGSAISTGNSSVSNGLIVGVAIAGVIFVLAAAVFVARRRKRRHSVNEFQGTYVRDVGIDGDESIFTEDSAALKYIPSKKDSFYSAHSMTSSSAKGSKRSSSGSSVGLMPKDVVTGVTSRSVAQFDPSTAAAIALGGTAGEVFRRDSAASSKKSSTDSGRHGKMKNLTEAIDHGDWDAVAALAGSLASSSEEVSTISDYSSAREQLSSRSSISSMNSGDSVRAAQIEEMVRRGDWSGVAAAAQYFSSSKSLGSGAGSQNARSPPESPKRSFLNFVTGRRSVVSPAASAAIVPNSRDLLERDSEASEAVGVVMAEEVPSVADAGQNNTFETQSSSSHGSRKADAASPEKRKKRWFGRLRESKKDAASSEEAGTTPSSVDAKLQADLNEALDRGDWGAIEEISAKLDAAGTRTVSSGGRGKMDVPEGGEEPTLGAASLSALKSTKTPKRPGESPISSKRKEIDRAVERGDWDAVESLTSELLNTKQAALPKDAMYDTLMNLSPSKSSSPAKSPFRDTPSSSEWSGSPMEDKNRREKIRALIDAGDFKGVHVLSGIYEMEAKGTLPPTFANMSGDSGDNPGFAQGWLLGGTSNASSPPESVESGSARRMPPSPSTSTSTNNSSELREFERLVNAKDWRGLASFAGAEENLDDEDDDGTLLPRNLFKIDPLAPKDPPQSPNETDEEHVELRETGGPQPHVTDDDSDIGSIHGIERLIPHWQHRVDKYSPDSADEDSKPAAK